MALQGTFDTFPLPDVLGMLSATSKSGRLEVTGSGGAGTLWVDGPSIVGAACGTVVDPVDVLVTLLRFEDGEFLFEANEVAPPSDVVVPIDQALAVAAEYIAEWVSVESVLPSPDHIVTLRRALAGPEITITAASWSGLVAVGGGGPVRDLLARFGDADLDAARAICSLVDRGLLEVAAPVGGGAASWLSPAGSGPSPGAPAWSPPAPVAEPEPQPVVDRAAPEAPVPSAGPPAPAADPPQPEDGEVGTGQPWRDQVRQLLGTAHAEDPPRIVVERFGPSHTSPADEPPHPSAPTPTPTSRPAPDAGGDDGDRDVLLKFLGSVQK